MTTFGLKELGDLAKTFNDNPFGALAVIGLAWAVGHLLGRLRK